MTEYHSILAAVDLSPAAEAVCQRAAELSARYGARLTVLYVAEYIPPLDIAYEPITPSEWMVDEDVLVKRATESLQALMEKLAITHATQLVRLGVPKQMILDTAKEQQVDLIVLGSHGRHGIGRLLGSTADNILHHADCDVLAVRIKDE
jgi:universal stress protein A